MDLGEVGEFGGGDVEAVAVLFELAAVAGGAADRAAGGDVGVGAGEKLGDGLGEIRMHHLYQYILKMPLDR